MTGPRSSGSAPASKAPEINQEPERQNPLTQEQQQVLEDFIREMNSNVIPEIVRVVEERRVLATHSRQWPLKIGGG